MTARNPRPRCFRCRAEMRLPHGRSNAAAAQEQLSTTSGTRTLRVVCPACGAVNLVQVRGKGEGPEGDSPE